ncbi:hypothetical protein VPH35_035586 [Triticum aestivum]
MPAAANPDCFLENYNNREHFIAASWIQLASNDSPTKAQFFSADYGESRSGKSFQNLQNSWIFPEFQDFGKSHQRKCLELTECPCCSRLLRQNCHRATPDRCPSVRIARPRLLEQGRPLGFLRRRPPQFAVPDHPAAGAALAAAGQVLAAAGPHSRRSPASSAGPLPLCPLPPPGHPEAAVGPLCTGYRRRLRPKAAAEHQHLLHSSTP